ncbi:transcription elongation factor [Stereum hirsutum FP-91666 SS1]|uniref:transcription elongation factor n=1 Tax=Stereum hirsutum (strain FP-91666) TaxID=721885 RepID=UPI0004449FB3|nr:transcription elongation factor [Stereum hirsutum FP-91666 SS1]EIM84851.1 transcription elongation factor [Stereum hirsutum FP-91666 SS1]
MSDVIELKKLVKSLQQASSDKETIDVLQVLKKEAKITEAILRESKAGLAVGKLRSHATKEVSELAKEVVRQWKTEVDKEKKAAGAKSPVLNGKPAAPSRKNSVATPTTPTVSTPGSISNGSTTRTTKTDGINTDVTRDKTRDKCIELLYDALAFDSGAPSELIFQRAKAAEDAVFHTFNGTTGDYKTKIRSLVVNLKDKKNPGLRESVVSGDLPAAKLAKMTSQDMASEERKNADKKIKEENMFKALGAEEQQAETDAFQCGRCKQRKCRYRQAQTRSADEPMTTFVTCTVCNNRWKFS